MFGKSESVQTVKEFKLDENGNVLTEVISVTKDITWGRIKKKKIKNKKGAE